MNVLRLNNGNVVTVSGLDDVKELIREHISNEAIELIEQLEEKANFTTRKIQTDLGSYEASLEHDHRVFEDIRDECESILNVFNENKRPAREELMKIFGRIYNKCINEL